MRNKGKKEEKCWKCGDKYFTGHICVFYTRNEIAISDVCHSLHRVSRIEEDLNGPCVPPIVGSDLVLCPNSGECHTNMEDDSEKMMPGPRSHSS